MAFADTQSGEEQTGKNGRKGAKGRKDGNQEAVIKTKVVKDRIDDLLVLLSKAESAATKYGDAIKATAEASGINSGALRKFVSARAGEKFEDKKRDCEQLSLLFEEVGEK